VNCHACAEPMLTDHHGHWTHDGPCSGYPVPWTEDYTTCEHCGGELLRKGLSTHHRGCTADRPKPVVNRNRRCPICTLWHRPHCTGTAAEWPLAPLLEAAWARTAERTNVAAADEIGIDSALIYRHELSGLSDDQADRWACSLGLHPSLIWPSWFDAIEDPLAEQFLSTGWRTAWLYAHPDPQPIPQGQEAAA